MKAALRCTHAAQWLVNALDCCNLRAAACVLFGHQRSVCPGAVGSVSTCVEHLPGCVRCQNSVNAFSLPRTSRTKGGMVFPCRMIG